MGKFSKILVGDDSNHGITILCLKGLSGNSDCKRKAFIFRGYQAERFCRFKNYSSSIKGSSSSCVSDVGRIIDIKQPSVRVSYDLDEIGHPTLADVLKDYLK